MKGQGIVCENKHNTFIYIQVNGSLTNGSLALASELKMYYNYWVMFYTQQEIPFPVEDKKGF